MILNAYGILDGFVTILRLALVPLVVGLAFSTLRNWLSARDPAGRHAVEGRFYLLFLLAGLLLALNLLAWPLFYLLLQSYVPEWPGVMCIYGVTRVGTGSVGTSRHLPPLVAMLQLTKPLLVFLSGAWFVLHHINQRTRTAPLTGRVLIGLLAAGLLSGVDAAAEMAYLVIPKKEEFLASGCCTAVLDRDHGPGRFVPPQLLGKKLAGWLYPAYYTVNVLAVTSLLGCVRTCRRRLPTWWLAPLLVVAVITLIVNGVFLTEVAAPRLLHLPDHHCPYDLVAKAPPSVVATALFVGASFCVGWGCCAGSLGRGLESDPFVAGLAGTLFRLAALAYALSVLILSAELALA